MKRLVTISALTICLCRVMAQGDTLLLREVPVQSLPLKDAFQAGITVVSWDSARLSSYQGASLGVLLSAETGTFVKTYGVGSLATSSVRGAAAQHTKVIWNGFDVTNPMLGQADLAYFPVSSFGKIDFLPGAGASLYGGGTQGGLIRLQSLPLEGANYVAYTGGIASFGDLSQALQVQTREGTVTTQVAVQQRQAENRFPYTVGQQELKRENADYSTFAGMLHQQVKLPHNQLLMMSHWYQFNNRGIPTVMGVPMRGERLQNEFLRQVVAYRKQGKKVDIRGSAARFGESLVYIDPLMPLFSTTRFTKSAAEAELKWRISDRTDVLIGSQLTHDAVENEAYLQEVDRTTMALIAAIKQRFLHDRMSLTGSFRQEAVTGFSIPPIGSVGYEATLFKWMMLYGSGSRNYRIPTFNDLYYGTLGNPLLRPENGWGMEQSCRIGNAQRALWLTGYHNDYTDWISWQPQIGGLWRPVNRDVITQGVEIRGQVSQSLGAHTQLTLRSNGTYLQSTDRRTQQQLIYVPNFRMGNTLSLEVKNTTVSYAHELNGRRFITTDNMQALPFFQLGKCQLAHRRTLKSGVDVHSQLSIDNLWNATYQSIVNFPMPGRVYALTITIHFKQKIQ